MSAPRVVKNDIIGLAGNILGAVKGVGISFDDNPERWQSSAVGLAVDVVDREVAAFIAKTPGHPEQFDMYTDSIDLANGDDLPESIAGYSNVRVDTIPAEPSTIYEINRIRTGETVDSDDLEELQYYTIRGKKIYHTGTAAKIGLIPPPGSGSCCLSPKQYTYTVLAGVLRLMFAKDGEEGGLSSDFAREYSARIAMIKDDANAGIVREVPPLPQMTQQG